MVIKSILKEELRNSLKMRNSYERELRKLPVGSLLRRRIKGNYYYYIVLRKDKKVKFIYKGKKVSGELISKYKNAKILRKNKILYER